MFDCSSGPGCSKDGLNYLIYWINHYPPIEHARFLSDPLEIYYYYLKENILYLADQVLCHGENGGHDDERNC